MIFDGADGGLFPDINMNKPSFGRLLPLHADILKVPGVPNGAQVPLQGIFVVDVAITRVNAGLDGLGGDPAVPLDINLLNDLARLGHGTSGGGQRAKTADKDQHQRHYPGGRPQTSFLKRRQYMVTLRTSWSTS